MLILVKLLEKYVIKIYALGSAEPFQIEIGTCHVLNSIINVLGSAHEKIGV